MKKTLLMMFFAIALMFFVTKDIPFPLTGCNVSLVPTKSPQALTLVQAVYVDVNLLYNQINAATDKTYLPFSQGYADINLEIDSLILVDRARNKSGKMVTQDLLIQTLFKKYLKYHSDKGKLTEADIRVFKAYVNSALKPRLTSEFQTL